MCKKLNTPSAFNCDSNSIALSCVCTPLCRSKQSKKTYGQVEVERCRSSSLEEEEQEGEKELGEYDGVSCKGSKVG